MARASIDKVSGRFQRSGPCDGCGKTTQQTRTFKAPTYELMMKQGKAWKGPLLCRKCRS